MMRKISCRTLLVASFILASCHSKPVNIDCVSKMLAVETLPMKVELGVSPAYQYFIDNSENIELQECLIHNITNTMEMPDPRMSPHYNPFVVGDLAMFMLMDNHSLVLTDVLPDEAIESHKNIGIFAYFEYVNSNAQGRNKLLENVEQYYKQKAARKN